jgi:hypothetical protein
MATGTLPAPSAAAVRCAVAAGAALRVPAEAVAALRRPLDPRTGEPFPAAMLKNADEQTVVALAAVCEAIRAHGLGGRDFTRWGAVAAPRFLGRAAMSHTLHRFRQEGAWGISPHLIPNRSLHSVSGALSLALTIHGPNFGVGGGPAAESEGLAAAATLLSAGEVPGVWVALTGYTPELSPADPGAPAEEAPAAPGPLCTAVALALTAWGDGASGLQLLVGPPAGGAGGGPVGPVLTLDALADALTAGAAGAWRLGCGGWVELKWVAAENCP